METTARFADMFSAMGTEPRLRIMRLLLAAHPDGMVASDVGAELDIPPSTLSHHLEKLKNEELVNVRRDSKYLWYTANTEALKDLLRLSVRRMLHAQQGDRAASHCPDLQIERSPWN